MPLQTFQITTDVPDGYEATGEFRVPKKGEHFIASINGFGDRFYLATYDYDDGINRIILRPVWKWPEFVKPGTWLAMDKNGNWVFYETQPQIESIGVQTEWLPKGCAFVLAGAFKSFFNFTPPPCTDWRTSLRQKPH